MYIGDIKGEVNLIEKKIPIEKIIDSWQYKILCYTVLRRQKNETNING